MEDGSTHSAFKPKHAVDLDTRVVVAAPIHPADTATRGPTLEEAQKNLAAVSRIPATRRPTRGITRAMA
jgi:transposase